MILDSSNRPVDIEEELPDLDRYHFRQVVQWAFGIVRDCGLSPCIGFRFARILKQTFSCKAGRALHAKWKGFVRVGKRSSPQFPPLAMVILDMCMGCEDRTSERVPSIGDLFASFSGAMSFTRVQLVDAQMAVGEMVFWHLIPLSPFFVLADATSSPVEFRHASALLEAVIVAHVDVDAISTAMAVMAVARQDDDADSIIAGASERLQNAGYFSASSLRASAEARAATLAGVFGAIRVENKGWACRCKNSTVKRRPSPSLPVADDPCTASASPSSLSTPGWRPRPPKRSKHDGASSSSLGERVKTVN